MHRSPLIRETYALTVGLHGRVREDLTMKRSKGHTAQLKLTVSCEVIAALDDYARSQGLSLRDAARVALYSAPQVAHVIGHGPVPLRDVLGP